MERVSELGSAFTVNDSLALHSFSVWNENRYRPCVSAVLEPLQLFLQTFHFPQEISNHSILLYTLCFVLRQAIDLFYQRYETLFLGNKEVPACTATSNVLEGMKGMDEEPWGCMSVPIPYAHSACYWATSRVPAPTYCLALIHVCMPKMEQHCLDRPADGIS